MAGACARLPLLLLLVLLRSACWVALDPQVELARLRRELGRVDSPLSLLRLLAPTDARLCDHELLQRLEEDIADDTAAQEGLESLRSECNATKAEFTRGFPMIGGRALRPASTDVSARVLRVMAQLFKRAIPRSRCKPRAAVVALQPASSRYYYLPSCVSVKRCSGCCDLDEMSCEPIANRTAKKQVIVIDMVSSLGASLKAVKPVLVEEHIKCKCAV